MKLLEILIATIRGLDPTVVVALAAFALVGYALHVLT